MRNHSLKLSCHIPAFKREFLALTWSRSVQREVLHFHGLIEFKLLRRRHWLDLTYDWNLASIRSWTFETRLNALSFEPIHWSFNITNDYLWYGRWAVNFRMMLGTRRQLIGLHHQYHYTTAMSNLIFDLQLVNTRYDLDFNYYHSNHSIGGRLIKDRQHHPIDGYWNATANALHLNTPSMRSTSTITSTFIKSIVDAQHEKIGVLFERTTNQLTSNDSQIAQVSFVTGNGSVQCASIFFAPVQSVLDRSTPSSLARPSILLVERRPVHHDVRMVNAIILIVELHRSRTSNLASAQTRTRSPHQVHLPLSHCDL